MTKQIVSGNEALALGALRAGVKLVTGYPGTPSSRAIASLLSMNLKDVHVEWSTNEKVALEIATGAAWAGHRALCTMKMSGVNVAYDSLISVVYSGTTGGLVIYVADDPGAISGMAEQDTRGFALMADMPVFELASVAEVYDQIQQAFELSERVGTPVYFRLVTAVANSKSVVDIQKYDPPPDREPVLVKDIARYTKAGAAISMAQHRDVIARLEKCAPLIAEMGLNRLDLSERTGGVGVIVCGATAAYLPEGIDIAAKCGLEREAVSVLKISAFNPFPVKEVLSLLKHADTILVLEELEPYVEQRVYIEAYRNHLQRRIIGKLDGTFSRVGDYTVKQCVLGLAKAFDLIVPAELLEGVGAEAVASARPITVCAGCPHRGTYMAINQAIKKLKLGKDSVMVTGDIGCTILGMNPPFNTVWNEISMGASVSLAQGYVYAGVKTPVIATIGDSTFFHAGIPGLINAIQNQVPLTLIIMDNGWTAMTGMQVNAGTTLTAQKQGNRQVDIAKIIPALGVEHFFEMDPLDYPSATATIQKALELPGVKVILSRRECAIQARRSGAIVRRATIDPEKCILCKLCVSVTGCPALSIQGEKMVIDPELCTGCGLCAALCSQDAITVEPC